MQIFQSSLDDGGRPCPGKFCPICAGCQRLHRHGRYPRYRGLEGERAVWVQRYLCPQCRKTWSVIPPDMMPYLSVPVRRFEALSDAALAALADGNPRPPPATVKEQSFIRRQLRKLSERAPFLCGLLGQRLPLKAKTGVQAFWRALRKLGPLEEMLAALAREFKTSLLACYRSLHPPWQREPAPATAA
jgi:hypothetical protein